MVPSAAVAFECVPTVAPSATRLHAWSRHLLRLCYACPRAFVIGTILIALAGCEAAQISVSNGESSEGIELRQTTAITQPAPPELLEPNEELEPVTVVFVSSEQFIDSKEFRSVAALAQKSSCCTFEISAMPDEPTLESARHADQFAAQVGQRLIAEGADPDTVLVKDSAESTGSCPAGECADRLGAELVVKPAQTPTPAELRYHWNAWAEALDGETKEVIEFRPVPTLAIDATYDVIVDLAAGKYADANIVSVEVSREFGKRVDKAASETRAESMSFTPVLLLDPAYFASESGVLDPVSINLENARKTLTTRESERGAEPAGIPLSQQVPFARFSFEITTRDLPGYVSVGLSIWQGEKPVDEIAFPFCIAREGKLTECNPDRIPRNGVGGTILFDGFNQQDTLSASGPVAALHVIELSQTLVMAVFYVRGTAPAPPGSPYLVWKINNDTTVFVNSLKRRQDALGRVTGDPVAIGIDLTNDLFPYPNKQAQDALEALRTLLANHRSATPFEERSRPTIFIRYLRDRSGPFLYPLGLINPTGTPTDFIGYHFRVHTPLPLQPHETTPACVSRWLPVVPAVSNDPALVDGFSRIASRVRPQSPFSRSTGFRVSRTGAAVEAFTEMRPVHRWVSDRKEAPGTILAVLSHHYEDALYFNKTDSEVSSASVAKTFIDPSVAILAGCSTGAPGAGSLIGKLNVAGIDSVITTNTGIGGDLAGDFLECFMQQIDKSDATEGVSVSDAFDRAQACLYGISDSGNAASRYGPQVLSFTFAGNPHLKMCPPAGKPQ